MDIKDLKMVFYINILIAMKLLINVVKKEQKGEGTSQWTFGV